MIFIGSGDPAGMMVGMAVGRVVGSHAANMMNNAMQDMNQKMPVVPNMAAPVNQKENPVYTVYDDKNFYSLDRLIDFGMSTAVAQQMVNSMNHAIKNMQIPGAGNPMQPPQKEHYILVPDMVYYAMINGKQAGPFCETELTRLINDRKLCKGTYVWHTGLDEWKTIENIPAIMRLVALAPPPPPAAANIPTGEESGN